MKRRDLVVALALAALAGCGGGGGGGEEEPGCGDGVVQSGEECDDGGNNSNTTADACRTDCVAAACGDGVVDMKEDCDNGESNSDTAADACRTTCLAADCGDGILDSDEECDNGEANSNDDANACRENCDLASCGDEVVDMDEVCDDGDDVDTNDCANDCTTTAIWTQTATDVFPTGLAMDSAGNLLVVGVFPRQGPGSDLWLRKYDATGATLWTVTHDGAAGTAAGYGVAVDPADNVVVAGIETTVAGDADIFVGKYDSSGMEVWTRTFGGAYGGDDSAARIATDAAGNIVVAGAEAVGPMTMSGWITDAWIRKYDPAGNTLWTELTGHMLGGIDYASGVAVDAAGNVVVTGFEAMGAATFVQKFDPDGMSLWKEMYQGADNIQARGTGVAVDSMGDVLVSGWEETTAGVADVFVSKYAPTGGSALWTENYDSPAHGVDQAFDVAVDSDDNVLVTGLEVAGGMPDVWTGKFDASGLPLWTQTHNGPSRGADVGTGIRADAAGNVVVVGYEQRGAGFDLWLQKYLP